MEQTQIWILSGVLSLAMIVTGFLLTNWFKDISASIKSAIQVLNEIKIILTGYGKDIEHLKSEMERMNDRLNSHGERLHELEKK